jgi:NAD(P)H-dependent flavin oxidoreductase YrpB (nitropropane dioxygenase family)
VAAALSSGADAVRVGTRFLAAKEADSHPEYVEQLIGATGADTVLTDTFSVGWPDAPHRVLASCIEAVLGSGPDPVATMVLADGTATEVKRRSTSPPTTTTTGEISAMALYAGTGVGAVTRSQPAAEIVAELCGPLEGR